MNAFSLSINCLKLISLVCMALRELVLTSPTLFLSTAAAAAAKSLQSCPTLCDPIDGSPPGFPRPWDSPGKNTGMGCHFLLQCMKVKSEREVAQSCPTLHNPRSTAAYQAPPSMGFSRQKYWSGVPLPSPIQLLGMKNGKI